MTARSWFFGHSEMVRAIGSAGLLGVVVCLVWISPSLWFGSRPAGRGCVTWDPSEPPHGWKTTLETVSEDVPSSLGAKVEFNGTLSRTDERSPVIRVFLAAQSKDSVQGSSFFSHTPDRCWPAAGWRLESELPEYQKIQVGGTEFSFERRVFVKEYARELVYFGAIVDGQPYPGRMDHFLDYAERGSSGVNRLRFGQSVPRLETRALSWIGSIVRSRTRMDGPAQFLRISTPLTGNTVKDSDRLLSEFLQQWPQIRNSQ